MTARAKGLSDSAEALSTDCISLSYGGSQILHQVSLCIAPGQITGIVGPNGAGKSSLFNVLAGSITPDHGTVRLGHRDITHLSMHRRARNGIARTFQLARELNSLTVLENLLLAWPGNPGESLWRIFTNQRAILAAERAARARALSLLRRTRLLRLADAPAGSLSGGQKKLLELCRALMLEAAIILLDEPAAGVNPALMKELAAFIGELRGEGRTFAIIEHNMDLIATLCDKVYVLAGGSILTEGTFSEVTSDRRVQDAYLGMTL